MTLNLKFEEKDFETLRTFDTAVKRQLGKNVYVGSDSLCFFMEYPPELVALLRPLPGNGYFDNNKSVNQEKKAKLEALWNTLETGGQLEFTLESSLPDAKK